MQLEGNEGMHLASGCLPIFRGGDHQVAESIGGVEGPSGGWAGVGDGGSGRLT
jgi:hypothetical protein